MNRIKEVLNEQGRTVAWLAVQMGKSEAVTINYVANKTQPTIPVLYQIAGILDVDVRDLLVRN